LEVLPAMDTSSFRNAFARFVAIRGNCSILRSDNGTNFIAARRQMTDSETLNVVELKKELADKNCEWILNPPAASHFGGCWERKIGSVKRVLDGAMMTLHSRVLSFDEFSTLLQESAAIVNNTPLWEVSDHPDDPAPLSPASLLTLRESHVPMHDESFSEADLIAYGKRRWRRVQYLASQFWVRWRRDYIQQLQRRHKWRTTKRCASVDDIVLIKNKTEKRNRWPVARIVEVFHSHDNRVRSVKLLLPSINVGESRKFIVRSIHDLVLITKGASHSDACNV